MIMDMQCELITIDSQLVCRNALITCVMLAKSAWNKNETYTDNIHTSCYANVVAL